jgi:hypothetical protein
MVHSAMLILASGSAPRLSNPDSRSFAAHDRLYARVQWKTAMTIDERIEAIVMSLELLTHDVQDLKTAAQQDGENIRGLARIAEIHERRISRLEGDVETPR